MSFEIKLSQLANREEFEAAVADHISRLIAFAKEVGTPRPVAHPLVEASIKRMQHPVNSKLPDDYAADYHIVDDKPLMLETKEQALSLEDKKRICHATVQNAEQKAKESILPLRKRRLYALQMSPVLSKREEERTETDSEQFAAYVELQKKFNSIELVAAQAESDIEDLTEATVDSWQFPTFG